MRSDPLARRLSFALLCLVPFLAVVVVGVRGLRVPGVYQTVGVILFSAIVGAAWILGGRQLRAGAGAEQDLALAGALLITPFTLVSLLWVGLGTPWDATAEENVMRYVVLLVGSVAVTGGFVVVRESLHDAGERTYATLGFAANLLAGPAYLIWTALQVGVWSARLHAGQPPPTLVALNNAFDTLLFVACALTYMAAAAFSASLGRVRWLGRGATRLHVIVNLVALVLLSIRGLSFPDPAALSAPWYTSPGFVAGIPAVPWILPFLVGAVLLRRAGEARH